MIRLRPLNPELILLQYLPRKSMAKAPSAPRATPSRIRSMTTTAVASPTGTFAR